MVAVGNVETRPEKVDRLEHPPGMDRVQAHQLPFFLVEQVRARASRDRERLCASEASSKRWPP